MIYQPLELLFFLIFVVAIRGAPTQLDDATLLQNGEEAQRLNRLFQGPNPSNPCQDGQTACVETINIATCQGTSWKVTDVCSGSQSCFAQPLVSSSGTRVTCTSEKSAESLISATGATGGIFGNPNNNSTAEVHNSNTTESINEPSASQATSTSTTPASTRASGSKHNDSPVNTGGSDATVSTSQRSCPIPTHPSVSSDTTNVVPPHVTTLTLNPSQLTTLPPETHTIATEEASSIIASIKSTGRPTVAPETPNSNAPVSAPTS